MWSKVWNAMRTYGSYMTFPVSLLVGTLGYHLEWFIRGPSKTLQDKKSVSELRDDRKLEELVGQDSTQVLSLKDRLEFTPRAVLEKNRPEKN